MNYDVKLTPRRVDEAGIATDSTDRAAAWIAEIFKDLWGARAVVRDKIGSGATEEIAKLAQDPAMVVTTNAETYDITISTDDETLWEFDDDGTDVAVTLTAGTTQSAQDVVDDLMGVAAFAARALAFVTADGKVGVYSLNTGVTNSVEVKAVATDAYTILGLTEAVTSGDAKLWDAARATLLAEIESAITASETMIKLAINETGNTAKDDLVDLV
jgi:hypothetical protein